MRIAYISQYFFPEQYFNNLIAGELVKRGHQVHVICCVPNYGQDSFFAGYSNRLNRSETWNGVRIDRAWTVARGRSRLRLALNYLTYPVTASWTAWRKLKSKPDVSFVSMPSPVFQAFVAIFLKRVRRVPSVYWVQDIWPESATYTLNLRNPILVKPLNWICGWLHRQADCVLVQSAGFVPMITRFGVPEERIRVLPNTARAIYRPVPPEQAPAEAALMPQSGFRLVFAGNIGESQDFDTLIKAARELKTQDISWVIIGSGRGLERAKDQVARFGLTSKVLFLGRHPEERMPLLFAHADAMLVSLKDAPIFALTVPSKLQSYMACGKPIIASLKGEGARIMLEAGAGIVVPPGSPTALAEAILRMKSIPLQQRSDYGSRGLHYFQQNYSQEIVLDKLEATLKDTVSAMNPGIGEGGA
ncbi:MAG: glycosyltransferase family 4 protein [Gammaproteobacteria bacterium]|nr:glycosyltransferase family 4 protein [Gammaproteobacteria bacterium]